MPTDEPSATPEEPAEAEDVQNQVADDVQNEAADVQNAIAEPITPVIEVVDLHKEFGARKRSRWWFRRRPHLVTVVDGASFTIGPGTAVGYLAPAGVGKTTMVDLVTGETAPTSGTVRTCGLRPDVDREQLTQRVGVVSGTRSQLWQELPLEESLRILAEAHGLSEDHRLARRAELVERLNLAAFINIPAGKLSPGRRIRGEVAAALLHEPELLILDQPMVGLDVVSKERLRSFLREENRVHGRTVLITAEDLGDVEEVCDRLLVVDQGRVMHDGDLPDLINRAGVQRTLVVELTDTDRILDDVPGTTLIGVEAGGRRQRLSFTPGNTSAARVLTNVAARAGIRNLSLEEPDLAELIRRL